ncbi:MAG: S-layer homology domain-containing protein [Lachnospiraceae bacterium]|nr:S-layer homology domain-containing protein [Lachnospiraceae bacterium]
MESGASGRELFANRSRTPGDYVSLCFEGTGIRLYGKMDANHGWARVILRDVQQNMVLYDERKDMYSASEKFDELLYENMELEEGLYQIKVMVTGEPSGNLNNACVGVSRAVIYKGGRGGAADGTALEQKIAEMEAVDTSAYGAQTRQAVADAVADARYLLEHPLAAEADLASGLAMLEEAERAWAIPEILPEDILTEEAFRGDAVDLTDNIRNLPIGARVEVLQNVSTDRAGSFTGRVRVIFENGAGCEIEIPVVVREKEAAPVLPEEPDQPEEKLFPFTDLTQTPGSWKFESVKYVYNHDIMKGISGTNLFQPDHPLTRAMFATVLYRMAGEPETDFQDAFTDVSAGKWYSDAVIWANGRGIVSGFTDGSYGINKNITREQIAKMLNEYARVYGYNVSEVKNLSEFTDAARISGWAVDYMRWAAAVEMITGKPNGDGSYRLDPKGEATRAECAAMLMRFENRYNKRR